MKIRNALVTAASVCGLFLTVQSGFAGGPLEPPEPPGGTHEDARGGRAANHCQPLPHARGLG